MSANFDELKAFRDKLRKAAGTEKDKFIEDCTKELAARLLAKVIEKTPSITGNLRRGWTANNNRSNFEVSHVGSNYVITLINPVEYASFFEYGHRTPLHTRWVNGKFVLTISEQEINRIAPKLLEKRLNEWLKEVFR